MTDDAKPESLEPAREQLAASVAPKGMYFRLMVTPAASAALSTRIMAFSE